MIIQYRARRLLQSVAALIGVVFLFQLKSSRVLELRPPSTEFPPHSSDVVGIANTTVAPTVWTDVPQSTDAFSPLDDLPAGPNEMLRQYAPRDLWSHPAHLMDLFPTAAEKVWRAEFRMWYAEFLDALKKVTPELLTPTDNVTRKLSPEAIQAVEGAQLAATQFLYQAAVDGRSLPAWRPGYAATVAGGDGLRSAKGEGRRSKCGFTDRPTGDLHLTQNLIPLPTTSPRSLSPSDAADIIEVPDRMTARVLTPRVQTWFVARRLRWGLNLTGSAVALHSSSTNASRNGTESRDLFVAAEDTRMKTSRLGLTTLHGIPTAQPRSMCRSKTAHRLFDAWERSDARLFEGAIEVNTMMQHGVLPVVCEYITLVRPFVGPPPVAIAAWPHEVLHAIAVTAALHDYRVVEACRGFTEWSDSLKAFTWQSDPAAMTSKRLRQLPPVLRNTTVVWRLALKLRMHSAASLSGNRLALYIYSSLSWARKIRLSRVLMIEAISCRAAWGRDSVADAETENSQQEKRQLCGTGQQASWMLLERSIMATDAFVTAHRHAFAIPPSILQSRPSAGSNPRGEVRFQASLAARRCALFDAIAQDECNVEHNVISARCEPSLDAARAACATAKTAAHEQRTFGASRIPIAPEEAPDFSPLSTDDLLKQRIVGKEFDLVIYHVPSLDDLLRDAHIGGVPVDPHHGRPTSVESRLPFFSEVKKLSAQEAGDVRVAFYVTQPLFGPPACTRSMTGAQALQRKGLLSHTRGGSVINTGDGWFNQVQFLSQLGAVLWHHGVQCDADFTFV